MTEETIFAAALERQSATERKSFLDEVCAGDETLRRRVEALLGSHEGADQFLRKPALKQLAADTPDGATLGPEMPLDDRTEARPGLADGKSAAVLRSLEPAQRPASLGRLKHYEVLEVLGAGGFGTVLKVFDEKLHRVVAIKVLAPELAATATARQRFLREARAAAAVRHEHVIDIHAVDEEPIPHLVMEYIDGQTLQQKLDRTSAMSLKEILRIGLQIAEGLAAAHKQGLIHRDIKPSNVLLENGVERVKISDFGLARAVDDDSLTQSGLVAGTPQYMSPEQAEGHHLDQRSDLFSLGSVMYAMCTGRPPFRAETSLGVLRRVCDDTPHSIRDITTDIPAWLAAVIAKLHAKKPAERIQSARELADLLAQQLANLQMDGAPLPCLERESSRSGESVKAEATTSRSAAGPRTFSFYRLLFASISFVAILSGLAIWLFIARPWQGAGNQEQREANVTERAAPPSYDPGPVRKLPGPLELSQQASSADKLRLEDTLPGLPAKVPAKLVAILGKGPFLHKEHGGDTGVTDVTYSPDGKLIASANARFDPREGAFSGWEVKLWESATGKAVRAFPDHADAVMALAFSPDGACLVTGCRDGAVKVWEVASGKERLNLSGHPGRVRSVACSPDGKLIAGSSTGADSKVILWDAVDGKEKFTFDKQAAGVLCVAFSPDSSLLATVGELGDDSVRIWETATGKEIARLNTNPGGSRGAVFSLDNKCLVLVGQNKAGQVWDVATQQLVLELNGHTHWLLGVARSKDGTHLATASLDGAVRLWDAASGQLNRTFPDHAGGALCVAFHPDGKTLACGDAGGQVHLWDTTTGKKLFPQQHTGQVMAVAVSTDGNLLASAGADATVRLWDLATGRLRHNLSGHHGSVGTVAISPDGRTLASAGADRIVRLWGADTGAELQKLTGHDDAIRQVAFAPDGTTLASASLDGAVKRWDVKTGKLLSTFRGSGPCWCIGFSPDGKTLAAGDDGAIRLWDIGAGKSVATLRGHSTALRSLAFHPDGQTLASAASDANGAVRLWDLVTLKEKQALTGHAGPVLTCAWRADGGVLFSCGGADGIVLAWDLAADQPRSQELSLFPAGKRFLHGIALTPEGRYLATANPDGTIYIVKLVK